MGGAVSTGNDNDELVDNLVDADYIKSPESERIFRAVDRADYFLPDHRDSAYKDLAWKNGHLHLSAPCIYSEVLESLELGEGMSFLNLGSGTGYLSTMAGLILGPYGVNHGVEIHEDVVEYAREKLEEFKNGAKALEEFEFSEPRFVVGNCLQLNSACRLYDRAYCGAACPVEHEIYMRNLIKVGGILVMPLNDQLLQIRRVGETEWTTKSVLPVSFATLIAANKDKPDVVDLPDFQVLSLQDVCRHKVRTVIRNNIVAEFPNITRPRRRPPSSRPTSIMRRERGGRGRMVNIVPMQMGMMILDSLVENQGISDDDDDIDDDEDERASNDGMGHRRRGSEDDNSSTTHCFDEDEEDEEKEIGKQAEDDDGQKTNNHTPAHTDNTSERKPSPDHNNHSARAEGLEAEERPTTPKEEKAETSSAKPSTSTHTTATNNNNNTTDNKRCSPSSVSQGGARGDNNNGSKRMRWVEATKRGGKGRDSDEGDVEQGGEEGDSSVDMFPIPVTGGRPSSRRRTQRELSSEDSDMENMDLDQHTGEAGAGGAGSGSGFPQAPATPTSVLNALHLLSIPRKLRCSSSNSGDTSETSGFGSFGEEPLMDLPGLNGEEQEDSETSSPEEEEEEEEDGGGERSRSSFEEEGLVRLAHKIAMAKKKSDKSSRSGEWDGSSSKTAKGGSCGSSTTDEQQYEGPTLGQLMKERINLLPLPLALRSYICPKCME